MTDPLACSSADQGLRFRRYSRQVAVHGVGSEGQAALARAEVDVRGRGPDAEVCALYLVGAGVGRVAVDGGLAETCRGLNTEVSVLEGCAFQGSDVEVAILLPVHAEYRPRGDDPVLRGSQAARWVLARILREGTHRASTHDAR